MRKNTISAQIEKALVREVHNIHDTDRFVSIFFTDLEL